MNGVKKGVGFHYAYLIVFACCMIIFTTTSMTYGCAGIHYNPVSAEFGIGRGTLALYMSILCFSAMVMLPFAGKILQGFNARWVLSVAVATVGVCFFVMSRATTVYVFYVVGVFLGISQAFLLYLTVPTLVNRWFKVHVGFFIGLCGSFSGFGGLVFNPMAGYIITHYGWRTSYMAFCLIVLCVCLPVTMLLVRSFPEEKGLKPYGADKVTAGLAAAPVTGVAHRNVVRNPVFPVMLVFAFSVAFVTNINYYLPVIAGSLGYSIILASQVAAASGVGTIIGKVSLGWINDRSVKAGIVTCIGSGVLGMLVMIFFGRLSFYALIFGAFLYGVSYASVNTQNPMLVKKVVGDREYPQIYSNIAMAAALSSTFGVATWGFIMDATNNYVIVLSIGICIFAVAFAMGFFALNLAKNLVHTSVDTPEADPAMLAR